MQVSLRRGGLAFAACLVVLGGASVPSEAAGPAKIDLFTPDQLGRGRATEVTVRVGKNAVVQSAEVTPPEDVTVGGIKVLDQKANQGMKRWSLVFTVDGKAAPGKRSVVLVTSEGRTAPQAVEIPPHLPELSDLVVSKAQRSPISVEFAVTVADAEKDFGPEASSNSQLRCGGSFIFSMGTAKAVPMDGGKHRVSLTVGLPNSAVTQATVCDLEVELADQKGYKGRTTGTVEFK